MSENENVKSGGGGRPKNNLWNQVLKASPTDTFVTCKNCNAKVPGRIDKIKIHLTSKKCKGMIHNIDSDNELEHRHENTSNEKSDSKAQTHDDPVSDNSRPCSSLSMQSVLSDQDHFHDPLNTSDIDLTLGDDGIAAEQANINVNMDRTKNVFDVLCTASSSSTPYKEKAANSQVKRKRSNQEIRVR